MRFVGVLSWFVPSSNLIAHVPGQSLGPTPEMTPWCQPGATTILRQVRGQVYLSIFPNIAPLRLNVLSDVELFLTCDASVLPQHAL